MKLSSLVHKLKEHGYEMPSKQVLEHMETEVSKEISIWVGHLTPAVS